VKSGSSSLDDVIPQHADTVQRQHRISHGHLEVRFLPHGQDLRSARPWRPQRDTAMPQWCAAEERGSFEAYVHRQKQGYQIVLGAPPELRARRLLSLKTRITQRSFLMWGHAVSPR